jgi:hypothetical protein
MFIPDVLIPDINVAIASWNKVYAVSLNPVSLAMFTGYIRYVFIVNE